MSLKLRLNLIITLLLTMVFVAGIILNIINARQNVRAEVDSTEKLALYLFDTGLLQNPGEVFSKTTNNPLRLQSLKHMRHVRIQFYDAQNKLLDSNRQQDEPVQRSNPPDWFKRALDAFSPPWQAQEREVKYQEKLLGKLVITPDPTYEYAEIWKQLLDLLLLLSLFFVAINLMIYWALARALEPTLSILQTLNLVEGGNMQARLPTFKLPELAKIGDKFNLMVETLEQSILRNHQLSQQLINLQEFERKNLARDLHDEFGQSLTAIHADSTVVLKLAQTKYPELKASALAITQLSKHLMEMVGGLLQRLRPGALDELGLIEALQELLAMWRVRNESISCMLSIEGELPTNLHEALRVTVYRLVQECLTNIARHAEATQVIIKLVNDTEKRSLHISVYDNGKGFNVSDLTGFGLLGMRERVEGLGGKLTINSKVSGKSGTTIEAWLPLGD
jgi:two-component system, NarL family, sensor histidine kinase UhpB